MSGNISPRIIAGEYRGRKLVYPKDAGIRPTTDRVKESLFNILQPRIYGAAFLDLFAGTGSIGLEALSRGAARVTFADSGAQSVKAIKSTLKLLDAESRAEVYRGDYISVLNGLTEAFDIIYLDPPYKSDFYANAIRVIRERSLINPDGLIIAEHNKGFDAEGLNIADNRKYGKVELTFIEAQ